MKYACRQRYFDNGLVTAVVYPVIDENYKGYRKEFATCDEYVDVFDSKKEAEQCKQDALNA